MYLVAMGKFLIDLCWLPTNQMSNQDFHYWPYLFISLTLIKLHVFKFYLQPFNYSISMYSHTKRTDQLASLVLHCFQTENIRSAW